VRGVEGDENSGGCVGTCDSSLDVAGLSDLPLNDK
jgi:hypothetical protein